MERVVKTDFGLYTKNNRNILLLPDIHAGNIQWEVSKSVYRPRAGYKAPLVPEVSHTEQWGETVGGRNSTVSSSSEEEISSARPGHRKATASVWKEENGL